MEKDKVQLDDEIGNENVERVNIEPVALSDADLDNVAGGTSIINVTNDWLGSHATFAKTTYTVK